MPSLDLGTLKISVLADNTQAKAGLQEIGEVSKKVSTSATTDWKAVGDKLGQIGSNLTKSLTLPLVAAAGAAIKYASDLNETMGKAEVVFGKNAKAIKKWSETSIDKMGLAQQTALDMAAGFGDMASSMGLSESQSYSMSTSLTELAADMASFKNISVERAQVALNAVFTGETESLKALGIVMTDANLTQFAMTQGIKKNINQMTQAEKVQLRYQFVMENTTNAQGDFARTGDSVANQTRKVGESLKETAANFGNVMLPAVAGALEGINNFLQGLMSLDEGQLKTIITIAAVAAAIPLLITAIAGVVNAIQGVQVAMAFLAANPVVLGIMAVVAALALITGGLISAKLAANQTDDAIGGIEGTEADVSLTYSGSTNDDLTNTDTTLNTIDGKVAAAIVTVDSMTAEEKAKAIEDKLITILGYDGETITLEMTNEKFLANADTIQSKMGALIIQNKDWKQGVTDLIDEVNKSTEAQIEQIKTFGAQQLIQIRQQYSDGLITYEQANEMYNGVVNNYGLAIQKTEEAGEKQKEVLKLFDDSGIANDFDTWINGFEDTAEATDESASATERAEIAQNNLQQKQQLGIDTTNLLDTDTIALKEAMNDLAQTITEKANKAYQDAQNELQKLYTKENNEIKQADYLIDATGRKADALMRWSLQVSASGDNYETNVEMIKSLTDEEKQYLIDAYGSLEEAARQNSTTLYNDALKASQVHEELVKNSEKTKADIAEKYAELRKLEEQGLGDKLNELTTGWSVEELAIMRAHFVEIGDMETANQIERLMGYEAGNGEMLEEQKEGNGSFLTKAKQFLSDLGLLEDSAGKEGKKIGGSFGSGIYDKIKSWFSDIIEKAKNWVAELVRIMRQALNINSPSKVMAKEVGSPIGEGIALGFEDSMDDVYGLAKKSMKKLTVVGNGAAKEAEKEIATTRLSAGSTNTTSKTANIEQNITFAGKTMTPNEQRLQVKRLSRDLAEVYV